jgi:hypothetical protein
MRPVQTDGRIRLLTNKTAQDHTTHMHGYARRRVEELVNDALVDFVTILVTAILLVGAATLCSPLAVVSSGSSWRARSSSAPALSFICIVPTGPCRFSGPVSFRHLNSVPYDPLCNSPCS